MPRVSDQHLAARRRQILDAAARCFVAEGFHQTSMQDVIKAAGLSVGAFYRYFPSKTDLIRAIAEETVGELLAELDATVADATFDTVADATFDTVADATLHDAMWQALTIAEKRISGDQRAKLAVQVWAEALRDPELGELVADIYQRVRGRFTRLAARAGHDHPEAVGAVLFGLMQGFILQRLLVGGIDASTYHAGIATLIR